MVSSRFLVLAAAGVFVACSANAASLTGSSPGFHYFWKAGAGIAEHDADLVACQLATRALINGGSNMTDTIGAAAGAGGGFAGGFLGAIVGGIIDNNENRQGAAANTEGCMAIKGWSVVGLSESEGEALEEPDDPTAIHAKLAPLVNAPAPAGQALRSPFANELAIGDFKVEKARDLEEVSLSVRAVRDQVDAAFAAAGELKPPKPNPPEGLKAPKPAKTMKEETLPAVDPSRTYVLLRIIGGTIGLNSTSILLQRLNRDGSEVVYDGAVVRAVLGGRPKLRKGTAGDDKFYDYVVEIPSGLWKLSEISYAQFGADLCFGAPAFEAKVGDAIFLGSMPVAGGYPLTVDLAVGGEILAANPALAEKVRAPEWTNGFTSDCFGSYAYAYEIPGAPFVDMAALARAAGASAPNGVAPAEIPAEPGSATRPADGDSALDQPADAMPSEMGEE